MPVMVLLGTIAGSAAFGDAAAIVTLMLRLYRADHPTWAITALLFAILGPSVILAPFAGRVLARTRLGPALVGVSACQTAAAVALIFFRSAPLTLLLVAVIGAGLAVTAPALLQLTPSLVDPGRLIWANSLTRSADWSGWTAGPVAGGALCALGVPAAALALEAASFVVAGVCFAVLALRVTEQTPEPAPAPGRLGLTITAALGRIRRDRVLTGLLASVVVTNLCVSMIGVAEVFFARDVLRTGSLGFAVLSSAWFAGMIAGTVVAPRADAWRPALMTLAGIGLAGAGIIGVAATGGLIVALLPYGLAGAGFGLQSTIVRGLMQRRAAGPSLGAVTGVWVAADMTSQLAGYLAGGAAMVAGARFTFAIAGAGLCVASLGGRLAGGQV
jgi:Na+/melibiose symporter-like transporter